MAKQIASFIYKSGIGDIIRQEYNTILEKVAAKQQRQLERQQARAAAEAVKQDQTDAESSSSGI
jgi:hypothetical protein